MTAVLVVLVGINVVLIGLGCWAAIDSRRTRRMARYEVEANREVMRAKGITPESEENP